MGTMLRTWLCQAVTASSLGLCALSYAAAAEPTAAEKQYDRLKDAEKHNDKLLAERWHKLVRQRQWVDSTGKHKTYARYVDHDPQGQWVKLLVLVKKGDEQSYKEGTIPLARLSKNDQALVKRIGIVRKQVETALADAPPGESPVGEGEAFGELAETREMRGEEATVGPEAAAALPREQMPATAPPGVAAMEPWRTDFAAFAANISTAGGREGPQEGLSTLTWGELHGLKAVYEMEQMLAMVRKLPADQQPPLLVQLQQSMACVVARMALGEVAWTANLDGSAGAAASEAGLTHDLQLPPPLVLVLIPDPDYAGDASRFGGGQPVQFIGRFAEVGGSGDTPQLKLLVRLPGEERASTPTPVSASSTAAKPTPNSPPPFRQVGPALSDQSVASSDVPTGRPTSAPENMVEGSRPNLADGAVWRTDVNAFVRNLSATKGPDGKWILAWGELEQLKNAWAAKVREAESFKVDAAGRQRLAAAAEAQEAAKQTFNMMGEVAWEGTLTRPISANAATGVSIDLPQPAPPFKIALIREEVAGNYEPLVVGDRVRFIGRFTDIIDRPNGEMEIRLRVRFPDEQPQK